MSTFEPLDPQFEAKVRDSFARQIIMATIGASLTRVEPGIVDITLPFRQDLTQQHSFMHAGILATVADSSCGYAAFSLMPADAAVLSIEFKINLLAPAEGESFIARGRVLRAGRTIMTDVFALRDAREKLVSTMLGTMMVVRDRPGLVG
jgi:uncharacterized protein (TIGR00369 family)